MPDKNKELDALLNNPPEDEEEEEKKEDEEEEENEEGEENEEEENEEGEEGEEKGEGEEEGEDSKKKEKDRWHGKSREDVIKEFNEQEKKAKDLEIKLAEKEKGKGEEEGEEKEKEKKEEIPSDEEFQKMTPKGFATWILGEIEKRIGKTYEEKTSARDTALIEIREAKKDHPLLKTSPEYRELVLALIDTAAQKGKTIPLKEACEKVDAFAGKQKGEEGEEMTEEEKARLKKAKAQLESGKGIPSVPKEEREKEQQRVEKIFGEGTPKSPLGGLGV